jgi:hypothetical protein
MSLLDAVGTTAYTYTDFGSPWGDDTVSWTEGKVSKPRMDTLPARRSRYHRNPSLTQEWGQGNDDKPHSLVPIPMFASGIGTSGAQCAESGNLWQENSESHDCHTNFQKAEGFTVKGTALFVASRSHSYHYPEKLWQAAQVPGVRPSPAAESADATAAMKRGRSAGRTSVSAPGDGRTPFDCGSAALGPSVSISGFQRLFPGSRTGLRSTRPAKAPKRPDASCARPPR